MTAVHAETPMQFDAATESWKCLTCEREITPKMLRDSLGTMPWDEP